MEHHLTKESIDSDRGKSLDKLMGDETVCIDSILFFIGLSLGLVQDGIDSWKDFVYCDRDKSKTACELLNQLIDIGVITETEEDEEFFYKLKRE